MGDLDDDTRLSYRPPNMAPGWVSALLACAPNVLTRRSPVCMSPCCCVGDWMLHAIRDGADNPSPRDMVQRTLGVAATCTWAISDPPVVTQVDVRTDQDVFLDTMLARSHPGCPGFLRGVWWMRDNVANERFVTFEDAEWHSPLFGRKTLKTNWTRDATAHGAALLWFNSMSVTTPIPIEVSPDAKWIKITGNNAWIYVVQPGEEFRYPDDWWDTAQRGQVAAEHGDLVRVTFDKDISSPDSLRGSTGMPFATPMNYQYAIKRVAYHTPDGAITSTPAWAEYIRRCTLQPERSPGCGGCCLLNLLVCGGREALATMFFVENPSQLVVYATQHPDERPDSGQFQMAR